MMVSVIATWGRRMCVVGRVLSRMPATVLLAAVGLAWALSTIITTVSSTGSEAAAATPPVLEGSVRLVAYGSGGGQCTDPSCGGGMPKWDPAQGSGNAWGAGTQNSGGGALDWASNLLGLDSGTQSGASQDETAKPPQPGSPEQSAGNPAKLDSGGLIGWATQLAKDLTSTITDALGKLGIDSGGGGTEQGSQPDQSAASPDQAGKPDDQAGKPDDQDKAGKSKDKAGKPD
ncbi:MAG: hypothetical protein J2P32_04305, partial [Actinobacteria bacterium]|nr:hypothetical protein [Actinomycetota bacterium]